MNNYDEIYKNLFIGDIKSANDIDFINKYNIKYIINLSNEEINLFPDIKYKHIKIQDLPSENILQYFDTCFDIIDNCLENDIAILVNCFAGMSRSASIIVAYFIKKNNLTVFEAHSLVYTKRPIIYINRGFLMQLQNYYKILKTK
jgi:protein-tyrosine phosphatase